MCNLAPVKLRTNQNKLPSSVATMMPDIGFMTLHYHFCLKPTPIHPYLYRENRSWCCNILRLDSLETNTAQLTLTPTRTDQRTATEHIRTPGHFLVIDQQVWTHCCR